MEKIESVFVGDSYLVCYADVAFVREDDTGDGRLEIYGRPGSGVPEAGFHKNIEIRGYEEIKKFKLGWIAYRKAVDPINWVNLGLEPPK